MVEYITDTHLRISNLYRPVEFYARFSTNAFVLLAVFISFSDKIAQVVCPVQWDAGSDVSRTYNFSTLIYFSTLQTSNKSRTFAQKTNRVRKYHSVFLGTGTNLGDRAFNLKHANALIESQIGSIRKQSTIYETGAWGITDQPDFLNQVIEVATLLPPAAVLEKIHSIEQTMGRQRLQKWGTRTIDIDILFYDDIFYQTDSLTIPHPHLRERKFVLVPLVEIAPDIIHPNLGVNMQQLLNSCDDEIMVRKWFGGSSKVVRK